MLMEKFFKIILPHVYYLYRPRMVDGDLKVKTLCFCVKLKPSAPSDAMLYYFGPKAVHCGWSAGDFRGFKQYLTGEFFVKYAKAPVPGEGWNREWNETLHPYTDAPYSEFVEFIKSLYNAPFWDEEKFK